MKLLIGRFALGLVIMVQAMATLAADVVLIQGVTVHRTDEQLPAQVEDVLVLENRIAEIGPSLAVPGVAEQDIEIIDGQGLHLTGGLFVAYTQLGLNEIDLEATTIESKLTEVAIGPAFDVQYGFNPASVSVRVNLVEGVIYGGMAPQVGSDPLAGLGAVANYATGELVQTGAALFGGVGASVAPWVGGSRAEIFGRLRRNFNALASFRPKGYVPGPGEYSRVDMQALASAVKNDTPLVMHAHRAVDIRQLLALAADFDLRWVLRGGAEAWQVAAELAAADVAVILDPLENLPLSFDQLGARLDNAALLHAAGVEIAIVVADLHNARLVRQHAGNAVAHGLPWAVALDAITHAPARLYGLKELNQVAPGAEATFVLWQGDPLEVTSYAQRVMSAGRWLSTDSRQTELFKRYSELNNTAVDGFKFR